MRTLVVVPTYNEKETIGSLLDCIFEFDQVDVLIVDDSSPDGTGSLPDERASRLLLDIVSSTKRASIGLPNRVPIQHPNL